MTKLRGISDPFPGKSTRKNESQIGQRDWFYRVYLKKISKFEKGIAPKRCSRKNLQPFEVLQNVTLRGTCENLNFKRT